MSLSLSAVLLVVLAFVSLNKDKRRIKCLQVPNPVSSAIFVVVAIVGATARTDVLVLILSPWSSRGFCPMLEAKRDKE